MTLTHGSYPEDMKHGYRQIFSWKMEAGLLPEHAVHVMCEMLRGGVSRYAKEDDIYSLANKRFIIVGQGSLGCGELIAIYRHDDYWRVIAFSHSDWKYTYQSRDITLDREALRLIAQLKGEVEAGKEDEKELIKVRHELYSARDKCVVLEQAVADERELRLCAERDREYLKARLKSVDGDKQKFAADNARLAADKRALSKDLEELKQVNHNLNIEILTLKEVIQMLAGR